MAPARMRRKGWSTRAASLGLVLRIARLFTSLTGRLHSSSLIYSLRASPPCRPISECSSDPSSSLHVSPLLTPFLIRSENWALALCGWRFYSRVRKGASTGLDPDCGVRSLAMEWQLALACGRRASPHVLVKHLAGRGDAQAVRAGLLVCEPFPLTTSVRQLHPHFGDLLASCHFLCRSVYHDAALLSPGLKEGEFVGEQTD